MPTLLLAAAFLIAGCAKHGSGTDNTFELKDGKLFFRGGEITSVEIREETYGGGSFGGLATIKLEEISVRDTSGAPTLVARIKPYQGYGSTESEDAGSLRIILNRWQ